MRFQRKLFFLLLFALENSKTDQEKLRINSEESKFPDGCSFAFVRLLASYFGLQSNVKTNKTYIAKDVCWGIQNREAVGKDKAAVWIQWIKFHKVMPVP